MARVGNLEEAVYYVLATGLVIQAHTCLSGFQIHQTEASRICSQLKMHLEIYCKIATSDSLWNKKGWKSII